MRKIAGYLTKNSSENGLKIAQSAHENKYIKPRATSFVEIQNSFSIIGLVIDLEIDDALPLENVYLAFPRQPADGAG